MYIYGVATLHISNTFFYRVQHVNVRIRVCLIFLLALGQRSYAELCMKQWRAWGRGYCVLPSHMYVFSVRACPVVSSIRFVSP